MKQTFKRDLMGFEPFFYTLHKGKFFYSDNLDELINTSGITLEPDPDAMYSFLHYGAVALDKTMYKHIYRLPPAHQMTVENNKVISIERYWFPEKIEINYKISFEEAKERFLELFDDALSTLDIDDPSLIFQLSGGLDSSSIVCYLAKKYPNKTIRTVSMIFDDVTADEREYIRAVEEMYPNIEALHIDINHLDYKETYSTIQLYKKQPHWPFFTSMPPYVTLYEHLYQKGIKTVVTGLGGDELLQGTPLVMSDHLRKFQWISLVKELKKCNKPLKCFKHHALYPLLGDKNVKRLKKLFGCTIQQSKYPKNFTDLEETFHCSSHAQCREVGFITSALNNYLIESSYMSWAKKNFCMQFKHPFYNDKFMEFLIALPGEYKYREGTSKYLLRQAMQEILPTLISTRTDAASFWGIYCNRINEILSNSQAYVKSYNDHFISPEEIKQLLNNYKKEPSSFSFLLSRMLTLAVWYHTIDAH